MTSSSEIHKCTAPDVLRTCKDAFDRAITEEAASSTGLVIVRGDTIVIRLHKSETGLDIIVKQPHSRAVISEGVAFWVKRIDTAPDKREDPPLLVVVASDALHLYMTDHEGDPLLSSPISDEETAEIASLIANGQPVPVDIIESDY